MAYAIDRQRVSQIGEYGYEPPANQTGIVTPTFSSWVEARARQGSTATTPRRRSRSWRRPAYKESGGIFQTPGQAALVHDDQHRRLLRLGRLGPGDRERAEGGRHQGHAREPRPARPTTATSTTASTSSPTTATRPAARRPYYELRQLLYSPNSAADRQARVDELGALLNPAIDKLFDQYAATTSTATQHAIVDAARAGDGATTSR